MKKLFMVALLSLTVAVSAFAKDTKKANTAAANSFKTEFKKASDVTWTSTGSYAKATFILNNERMEAFYNADGDKIATSKAISMDELPGSAQKAFAKKYDGYTVKEAIELTNAEETAYYISASNEKEFVILKVTDADGLSIYKRTKN